MINITLKDPENRVHNIINTLLEYKLTYPKLTQVKMIKEIQNITEKNIGQILKKKNMKIKEDINPHIMKKNIIQIILHQSLVINMTTEKTIQVMNYKNQK